MSSSSDDSQSDTMELLQTLRKQLLLKQQQNEQKRRDKKKQVLLSFEQNLKVLYGEFDEEMRGLEQEYSMKLNGLMTLRNEEFKKFESAMEQMQQNKGFFEQLRGQLRSKVMELNVAI